MRRLIRVTAFLLCGAVLLAVGLYPKESTATATEPVVVRVWNVDTFEGGKGSRASFLKKVALRAESQRTGVYYMVTSYTAEGARAAYERGDRPDVLSFGVGLDCFAESSFPLNARFAGGEADGKCIAYPWCRGGYALFSLTDDFSEAGKTAISEGGTNLVSVAAAMSGIAGEPCDSLAAYVGFLGGEYRYLLGTQRDMCRFSARSVDVFYRPLPVYCDLYQYVSVLSSERKEACDLFVETLLSEKTQSELSSIGMYSASETGEFPGRPEWTLSAFASPQALEELRNLASSGAEIKIIANYLKSI
ncbi:MAG: hypothetical protein ACI4NG_06090 [Candidatus Gallimonas sp.]